MGPSRQPPVPPVLGASIVELLEGPVSIVLATRGDDLAPDLVHGLGCRVLADGRVVVLLARSQAENVLECLASGAPLAVTFSRPTTFRTIQLKADGARIGSATSSDRAAWARHRQALVAELGALGFPPAYALAHTDVAPEDLVAVTFAPTALFEQTPGHGAGGCRCPTRWASRTGSRSGSAARPAPGSPR